MNFERKIKQRIIADLDDMYDKFADYNFRQLSDNNDDLDEEDCQEIENIFMCFRNIIAGTECDGSLNQEYEKYKV